MLHLVVVITPSQDILNMNFDRLLVDTVLEMAHSLVENNMVPKQPGYHPYKTRPYLRLTSAF